MMNRTETRDRLFPDCPIRNVLSRIGDKWSMLVLFTLEQHNPMRFGDLRRNIPDISQKMLTSTLRKLEQDGLLSRKVYPEVPPRVEYALTPRGESLMPHLTALIGWAEENFDAILEDREREKI